MKKTIRITLITAVVILVAAAAVLLALSQRVVMNPPGTVGNTAGNLNNDGLFCE